MTVVGLIGKIGAGKTTVSNLFRNHGAVVIDADALTHDALRNEGVQEQIRARFGTSVFTGNEIDRSRLAEYVFGNQPEQKNALKGFGGHNSSEGSDWARSTAAGDCSERSRSWSGKNGCRA